jgi:hypothetical protein
VAADPIRAVALVGDPLRAGWFSGELAAVRVVLQVARSVEQAVAALVDDPPPRAQLLFADFDALSPVDVVRLHGIRTRGWFGVVFAFGHVAPELVTSLRIARVFPSDVTGAVVREAVVKAAIDRPTTRIRTVTPPRDTRPPPSSRKKK